MEGVLGETFSGRLGDYMMRCMARLKKGRTGQCARQTPALLAVAVM